MFDMLVNTIGKKHVYFKRNTDGTTLVSADFMSTDVDALIRLYTYGDLKKAEKMLDALDSFTGYIYRDDDHFNLVIGF